MAIPRRSSLHPRPALLLPLLAALALAGCSPAGGGSSAPPPAAAGSGSASPGTGSSGSSAPAAPLDPLLQKALDFSADAQAIHTPDGLILDWNPVIQSYSGYADGGIWTGIYLASEALRFAATGDPLAEAAMDRSLRAFHVLQDITGEPGLYARSFTSAQPASTLGNNARAGTGAYAGWSWKGDVSKDQYIGIFFGYGVAWDHIRDPGLRALVRDDVARAVDRLIMDDLKIKEGGRQTTYGDLYAELGGVNVPVNAFNAVLALAILKTGAHITGDPVHAHQYRRHADRLGYASAVGNLLVLDAGPLRNYNNYNMALMALYLLIGLETDPALAGLYQQGLSRAFGDVRGEENAFFDMIYAARRQGGASPSVVQDALGPLHAFPSPNVDWPVVNSNDPAIVHSPFLDRNDHPQAVDPIPFARRVPSNFIWKSNPRRLDGGANSGEIFPGTAYLIAYWLGRFHGFI